jgi:isopentenyl-diphosphate delta-isomerase
MNRKDDHIRLALAQKTITNDFDRIRFKHQSLPESNLVNLDMTVTLFNKRFPLPFFINAMTGGSEQAKNMNERLAKLARHFKIPIATGSLSIAMKQPALLETFQVIRQVYPEAFIIGNIGAGHDWAYVESVKKLFSMQALQIHVNAPQEVLMPEGDKNLVGWTNKVKEVQAHIDIPLIIKEVGFGMSRETIKTLIECGVQYIDVAGRGGTNFAKIENARRTSALSIFDDWGLSTVESLLEAQGMNATIIASGGIRHGLDIVKAFALGAKAVGLSGYFLKLVSEHSFEEAIQAIEKLILEMKSAMMMLGVTNLLQLNQAPLILDSALLAYQKQIV